MWTPPHFWALALFRENDYARAGVPMLPVVAGASETRRQILLYSLVLVPVTFLPSLLGTTGMLYAVVTALLGAAFLWHAVDVYRLREGDAARPRLPAPFRLFDPLSFRHLRADPRRACHRRGAFRPGLRMSHVMDQKPFSPEDMARRRKRSIALALVLVGLVVVFFVTTIVRLGGDVRIETL